MVAEDNALPVPRAFQWLKRQPFRKPILRFGPMCLTERVCSRGTILIHGGSSGIGTTAIQLAKAFGSTVVVTAGSDGKCAECLGLGADVAINYRTQDFVEALKAAAWRQM